MTQWREGAKAQRNWEWRRDGFPLELGRLTAALWIPAFAGMVG